MKLGFGICVSLCHITLTIVCDWFFCLLHLIQDGRILVYSKIYPQQFNVSGSEPTFFRKQPGRVVGGFGPKTQNLGGTFFKTPKKLSLYTLIPNNSTLVCAHYIIYESLVSEFIIKNQKKLWKKVLILGGLRLLFGSFWLGFRWSAFGRLNTFDSIMI